MKRTLTSIAAASLVLGTMAPVAFAATSSVTWGQKSVAINGTVVATPYAYVSNGTTYFPIYYLQKAIPNFVKGATVGWDGTNMNINVPGLNASDIKVNGTGVGKNGIYINGVLVQSFTKQVQYDHGTKIWTSFAPIYDLFLSLNSLGIQSQWLNTGTQWNIVPPVMASALTIAGNSNIGVGGSDTLTLTAKDAMGNAVTVDPSKVMWSTTGGVISSNGVFAATAAGTYTVTANYMGMTATGTVAVYGTAVATKVTAPSTNIVANNNSTQTLTVSAVDANGNAVGNFSGTATISLGNYSAMKFAGSTSGYTNGLGAPQTLTFVNGVATISVVSGPTPGLSDVVTVSNITPTGAANALLNSGSTVTMNTVAQVATAVSLSAASSTLEVNDNTGTDVVTATVNDQTGNPMLYGVYALTVNVAGGGTLAATGNAGPQTVVVANNNSPTFTVDGVRTVTGTYTVTATSSGLTTGTVGISAVYAGNAAKLTASSSVTSFPEAGAGNSTTVTLGAADANGSTVAYPNTVVPKVSFTMNGTAEYPFTITPYTGNVAGAVVTPTTASVAGYYQLPAGTTSFVVTDSAQGADAGTYAMTVTDGETTSALAATAPQSFTMTAGAPSKLSISSSTNVFTTGHMTVTLTGQVTDGQGNAVPDNGTQIQFSAANSGSGSGSFGSGSFAASPLTSNPVTVDSTGKATITFTAQDYNSDIWSFNDTSVPALVTGAAATATVIDHPAASYSFSLEDQTSSSTVMAMAGDPVNFSAALNTTGLDAYGNSLTPANDGNDSVTVTVHHASGLSGLPIAVTGGTVSTNSTADTATFTGSLNNVSAAFGTATIKAAMAGVVTVSLSDSSTGASGTGSISVVAGSTLGGVAAPALVNAMTVTHSTLVPVTIQLTDVGGNPIVSANNQTVNISGTGALAGVTFETSSYVAEGSAVTIPAGQSSITGYLSIPSTTGTGTVTLSLAGTGFTSTSGTITVQ